MNYREFEDINSGLAEEGIQPQPHDAGYKPDAGHLNAANIKDRFLKALKEIANLEKIIEEKNSLLAESAKEKDRLTHALSNAVEEKKKLYDRLADFDIVRNMEILEFKEGLDKQSRERDLLLKENNSLMNDTFKKDKLIDDLKYVVEKRDVQLREAETNLYTAAEKMREIEAKYKDLEARYDASEQEKKDIKEEMQGLRQKAEIAPEYQNRIEELNNVIPDLKAAVDKKTNDGVSLKNDMSEVLIPTREMEEGGIGPQVVSEALTAENDDISFRLREASEQAAPPVEEKKDVELSADKRLLFSKSARDRFSDIRPQAKMIYLAPSGSDGAMLKAIAIGAAVLIILAIAGVFLSGRF